MENRQTVQVQDLHCLLTESSTEIRRRKKRKIPPSTPKIGNGLVQLIGVGNSIRRIWVKLQHEEANSVAKHHEKTQSDQSLRCPHKESFGP